MLGHCPACGGRRIRSSRPRSLGERLLAFIGVATIRCRDCRHRFRRDLWQFPKWSYARCPRCLRLDLTTWSPSSYHLSAWTRLRLGLGAKPFRCEYCRCNFASFRRLNRRFTFHKWRNKEGASRQAKK